MTTSKHSQPGSGAGLLIRVAWLFFAAAFGVCSTAVGATASHAATASAYSYDAASNPSAAMHGTTAAVESGFAVSAHSRAAVAVWGVAPSAGFVAADEGAAGKELVPYYPANGGFLGKPTPTTLDVGTRIDRYGSPYGKYTSPEGTPSYQRALPPGSDTKPYSVYEVARRIRVQSGTVAPAFGELGGGTQYLLPRSVQGLIDDGFLKEVSP